MDDKKEKILNSFKYRKYEYISDFCKEVFDDVDKRIDIKDVIDFLKIGVREIFNEKLIVKGDERGGYLVLVEDNEVGYFVY